jgi:3-oxoacyl-[acyl-carrier protein] reductase
MLLGSLFSQLVGMHVPGRHALYLGQELSFRRPVRVGETVSATAKVESKNAATRTVVLATEVRNAENAVVVSGTARVKVRDTGPVAAGAVAPPQVAAASGRAALVTGGSRGIGAAIAETLARRGIAVAVNYWKSADAASALVERIRGAGGRAVAVRADVRQEEEARAAVDEAAAALGGLDVVVPCAMGPLQQRRFTDLAWPDFQAHLEYQLRAVAGVARAAHGHLKARGGGALVTLLSQVVHGPPPPLLADYVAAKHALLGLSKALAVEWASDRIRVNAVSPGLVQTDLTQHYGERVFKSEALRTPLRRLATARDVADAVAYLAGDEAAFLTGVTLPLTGGQVME